MTLEELAAIGETLGGIGVIASLLYLAGQIRQSSKIARGATTQALLGNSANMNTIVAGDISPVMAKAWAGTALSDEEEFQYFSYMMAVFAQMWQAYHQHAQGMLEPEVFEAFERRTLDILARPRARKFWEEQEFRFSQSFRDYINELPSSAEAKP